MSKKEKSFPEAIEDFNKAWSKFFRGVAKNFMPFLNWAEANPKTFIFLAVIGGLAFYTMLFLDYYIF